MKNREDYLNQIEIDFESARLDWPENQKFPLNLPRENRNVLKEILEDISASKNYLIVTGFTSLSHIIDLFSVDAHSLEKERIRIILGFEPEIRSRKSWGRVDLSKEIKDYWVEKGYSLFKCGNLIKVMELIKSNKIEFKLLDKLHAKIYIGDTHAILGSANFSKNGLTRQLEANIRIPKKNDNKDEYATDQYENIKRIANNYYVLGEDYNARMLDLLSKLVKISNWQEALARAISELLDGNWFKEFPGLYEMLSNLKLWPVQFQGIGQALYILQNQGCVLIADPTGSGKTKLIATLQLLLFHWLWESGRRDKSYNLVICPPLIQEAWSSESTDIRFSVNSQLSMGLLSQTSNAKYKKIVKEIKNSNILVIDEAHNYLNLASNRSESISRHNADYIILSTATPINRKAKDLLRVIELLGVDNLGDEELKQFKVLKKTSYMSNQKDFDMLREYIKKFMVRRTKKYLKGLILKNPECYRDRDGNECCYPETDSKIYDTGETEGDIKIAYEINSLSGNLKGLVYLRKLDARELDIQFQNQDLETLVKKRLKSAKALSVFNVQASLRSSRIALVERIEGTEAASNYFDLGVSKKKSSGDLLSSLSRHRDSLPETNISPELLPKWLVDLSEYQKVCDEEIRIYREISNLAKMLSASREMSKVDKLIELLKRNKIIIAFDSIVISLEYFKAVIRDKYPDINCNTVTGDNIKNRKNFIKKFELGSDEENLVGLFSDCMSEGVNLQQASALVFLDMPSVLRIAEQRIGRIERLDSPHKEIQVYWPQDSEQFALKTDKKLIRVLMDAENLIGTNFELPEELQDISMEYIVKPEYMMSQIKKSESEDLAWDGIQDAFSAIHDLYDGDRPLITKVDYEYYKGVEAEVKVKLSIVKGAENWIFLAMKGSKAMAPRWYFIDANRNIYSELPEICGEIRARLATSSGESETWTQEMDALVGDYLKLLHENELAVLPNRRRRVLEVAQLVLKVHLGNAKDSKIKSLLGEVLNLFKPTLFEDEYKVDYYAFSQQWLDIFNPYLNEKRQNPKYRRRVVSLNDFKVKKEALKIELDESTLNRILDNVPYTMSVWGNIAACILGVASDQPSTSGLL